MLKTFTKDQVLALLADRENIKTDKHKIDCGSADQETKTYELTCPIFIRDSVSGLDLRFWVHQDCKIIENVPTIISFTHNSTKKTVMFSVAMSGSSNLIEGLTESQTESFIEEHLQLNDFFINEVKRAALLCV